MFLQVFSLLFLSFNCLVDTIITEPGTIINTRAKGIAGSKFIVGLFEGSPELY